MEELILIEGAMDEEIDVLKETLINKVDGEIDHYHYSKGKLNDIDVVILKTNIGMVNASISTTLAINKFHPTLIINQGTIGSHIKEAHPYDFIVANKIINTSSHIDGEEFSPSYYEDNQWKRGHLLLDISANSLIKRLKNTKGKILFGPIASSDTWNKNKIQINKIHGQYETLGEEMEGFASLQVAKLYNVPYLSIRVVSNNELNSEKYVKDTASHLQTEIIKLLK